MIIQNCMWRSYDCMELPKYISYMVIFGRMVQWLTQYIFPFTFLYSFLSFQYIKMWHRWKPIKNDPLVCDSWVQIHCKDQSKHWQGFSVYVSNWIPVLNILKHKTLDIFAEKIPISKHTQAGLLLSLIPSGCGWLQLSTASCHFFL